MTRGAYYFVAFVYLVLAAVFVASTALFIEEFAEVDWRALALMHSHLFIFFPVFGLLVLAAFYLPSVAFMHMYWYHVPYGRIRFAVGFFVAIAISLVVSQWLNASALRGVWEISPSALVADRGEPPGCGGPALPCERAPILATVAKLREAAPNRLGLSDFARSCKVDPLLPTPAEFKEERYCFPGLRLLPGRACCEVQSRFRSHVAVLRNDPQTRSQAADLDAVFLPFKVFFITVMVLVALMLAFWRNKIDALFKDRVPAIERGIMIGAIAMLFWPIMDYGYQQTSDVLFGRTYSTFNWRLSLVIGPWVVLLLFFFLRRFGKNLAMVGQIGGILGAVFAVLRYQDLNNWAQRFFGAGADDWIPYIYAALAMIGVAALLWPHRPPPPLSETDEVSSPGRAGRLRGPLT